MALDTITRSAPAAIPASKGNTSTALKSSAEIATDATASSVLVDRHA